MPVMKTHHGTDAVKDGVRLRFADWSRVYDRHILQRIVFKASHDQILEHIDKDAEIHVLDIGCGTGEFARRLLKHSGKTVVHGLDISREMIGLAARKFGFEKRISLKIGDVERLPYDSGTFDYITCSHSFHHYPDQKNAVTEMRRVLKPGGKVIIVDGCKDGLLGRVIYDFFVTKKEKDVYHLHSHEYGRLLSESGFIDIKQVVFNGLAPVLCTIATAVK